MKTFYSPIHLHHDPLAQFEGGVLAPAVEIPVRVERVRDEVTARKLGPILAPTHFDDAPILRVHDAGLVEFLGVAHAEWRKRYGENAPAALPSAWPAHGLRDGRHGDIEAKLGSYSFSADTPILRGTWEATREAVDVVLSAAQAIRAGDKNAFALSRPPGHHASSDVFGGFCYLNNIAIAAQWFVDAGMRPAILDVDYHHGNGTQSIFYTRNDVFFCSIHADPHFAYPHFLGFADERGDDAGEGFNLNLPLPAGTDWALYEQALAKGLAAVEAFGPDVLLVSLGLDTYMDDPISSFRLKPVDYLRMGEKIAALRKPTLFVFEGGYNVDALGEISVNVLEGFVGR
ncbi:MAG: histone deacetylase family protein [Alphaproteobacteria bacterium]|nr:histone deacetylase family protein [Alphaproteobacteria bacterium]MDE1986642.1 histone deacetylase family protein [Alphaproteobacteria bacterium]MDE2164623.1 histone deacetylase family protein [Alphaproteobacteria bacterium]